MDISSIETIGETVAVGVATLVAVCAGLDATLRAVVALATWVAALTPSPDDDLWVKRQAARVGTALDVMARVTDWLRGFVPGVRR